MVSSEEEPPPEAYLTSEGRSKSFGDTVNNHYSKAHMGDANDYRKFIYEAKPSEPQVQSPLEKLAFVVTATVCVAFFAVFFVCLYKYAWTGEPQPQLAVVQPALTLGAGEPQYRISGEGGEASTTPRLEQS
ncbi:hypothetical protein H2198_006391 [Neophaeococcomyces mojaviensis]|uniref:Uncharacterized protein n=1 Tax=Neophaeococcomyces mojaviensis TaxID=3383035 RepID=A0ACC3A337_9EURO|nr:hypothetical protein H2198_006391 [Knufia sp. JES_112]